MKIEDSPFINRHSELAHFKQIAREIAQGRGEDCLLVSPQGTGKTALIKEIREILFWGQEEVVPVYFSFSREFVDRLDFSGEYLVSLLSQILLFDQKEKMVSRGPASFSFSLLQREAEKQGKGIIEEVILHHQRAVGDRDEWKGLLNALTAPRRIAQHSNRPVWMFIDHIQGLYAFPENKPNLAGLWREALGTPWAPHLFSGEPPGFLVKTLLPSFGSPLLSVRELEPLPVVEGKELAMVLEKVFKVSIAQDLSQTWFRYLEQNPGFFSCLLRDARQMAPGIESHQRFIEIYLKSLWQGELGRVFENQVYHLNRMDSLTGYYLIRFLNILFKATQPMIPVTDFQKVGDLPSERVESMLRLLERAGIVRERFGTIGLEKNRVLEDWVEVLIRKYLYQEELNQLIKGLGRRMEDRFSKLDVEEKAPPAPEETLHFSITLPINRETELVAVRALEQIATYSDLDDGSIEKSKLALIEACINAGEHSQSFEKKIRVFFTVHPGAIEIVVEDRGQAFDPVAVQTRIVQEIDSLSRKRGRGLALIREMMDEVRFEKAEIGTRLVMVKKKQSVEKV